MKRTSRWAWAITACAFLALGLAPTGCGGTSLTTPATEADASPDPSSGSSGSTGPDAGTADLDAAAPPGVDGAAPVFDDGTPTRVACTSTLGHGLSPVHGRLDGTLVSIVGVKSGGCPSDPDHLHLQVKMAGAVYDIAINLDVFEGEVDTALPGAPYAEGWHPMNMDYARDLGLHSTQMTLTGKAAVRAHVENQLTNANHISVFGTGYPKSDGAHLIHRSSGGRDGALVLNHLAAKAHVIAFRFVNDTF